MPNETIPRNQLSDSKLARVINIKEKNQLIKSFFRQFFSSKSHNSEVIQLDKFNNFKMYEQFRDIQVGDIREIPDLLKIQAMCREYFEIWSLVFDPYREGQFDAHPNGVDFSVSFRNSSYAMHNSEQIAEQLSNLKNEESNFLIFPHLITTPLNEEDHYLATNMIESDQEKNWYLRIYQGVI
ncbi:MAG: hypothetical protein IC227_06020 [Enterococcus lacertideformus]|uniref:Uncharacterized protein n=1 Tax=Enterococcus lacertideformus TaxID=2771493 RepID=A0A931B2D5_9ENTE|nr:hypothetical protein [Enterococcus lacertideformus]